MSPARLTGGLTSVGIHAALLVLLVAAAPAPSMPIPTAVREKPEGEPDIRLVDQRSGGDGLACAESYRGIGLAHSWSGHITDVAPYGPAANAGIRVGDKFLSESIVVRDQYPLGHVLRIGIERDGREMLVDVTVGRVCYETERS